MERAKWRWLEWLKAHGYSFPGVDRLWSAPNILKEGTVTNALLADMADGTHKGRQLNAGTGVPEDLTPAQSRLVLNLDEIMEKVRFAGILDKGRVFGTLYKDRIGDGETVFSDFGGGYGPVFDIDDPGAVISYDATNGLNKNGTDAGTNDVDLDALVSGLGSASSIGYLTLCRVRSTALTAIMRFGGSQYAYTGYSGGKFFTNIRNDAGTSKTAWFASVGAQDEWALLYSLWPTSGAVIGYAIDENGTYETGNVTAGACTWIQSATYIRPFYDDKQDHRCDWILVDNPLTEADFRAAARIIIPWAREQGTGITFDLGPIGDFPMEILGQAGWIATQDHSTTYYYSPQAATVASTTEGEVEFPMSHYGTLKHFRINVDSNTLDDDSVWKVRLNGADTGITITFETTDTGWKTDLSNSVDVVPGDMITIEVDNTASSSGTIVALGMTLGKIQT